VQLLADDAIMISDGGAEGRTIGGQRSLPRPLQGAARIAAFVATATARTAGALQVEECQLNGQPAAVFRSGERVFAALLLLVADGKIQRVLFHADSLRLGHLAP
jgi:RNA polymerase sigma-70 factor (ECF subfamily)